jgi:hypothetical protein
MKAATKMNVVFAAILACLVLAAAESAVAAVNPTYRSNTNTTVTGQFGASSLLGESVTLNEPATLEPVIINWSGGYTINVADLYFGGLSVNGGPCSSLTYGNREIPDLSTLAGGDFLAFSFQWIVLPSDGVLVKGVNTFEVCVGGESSTSDSITITHNTITATLAK